jgi:hypothetical protein
MTVKIIDGIIFPYPLSLDNYPNDPFMKLMRKLEQGEDLHDNLLQPLLDRAEDIDLPRAEPCSA